MDERVGADTFGSISLDPQATAALGFPDFVKTVLDRTEHLKKERAAFYEVLRRSNTKWANGSRWVLALLGSVAFLLTAVAAALRFAEAAGDQPTLLAVLAIYAVMGAISFYEKGTDKTTAYFRQIGVILAIRDLWTKLQFEFLKELTALDKAPDRPAAEAAARDHLLALAQAFCADVDKAAAGEVTDWKTEFLSSLSELDAAAQKGAEGVTAKLQESIEAATKAAAAAGVAAEKAATEAEAAARSARDASRPGGVNLTLSGDFDDQVVISVDGRESARSTGKAIALDLVPTGLRKIGAQARKGSRTLEASVMVDIKPGLQQLTLALG